MIVFDVSTLVGAAIRRDSVPEQALRRALSHDQLALSEPVLAELVDVFSRPRITRFLDPELRDEVLSRIYAVGLLFNPGEPVNDCRDPKDNKYLELALAARAQLIISSDQDLLVLHPWRGVRILLPAKYMGEGDGPKA